MPHRPLAIANEFVRRHGGNVGIDHLKLQKLAYLSNGWWLTIRPERLSTERPQVWRYGPVFKSLYNSLAGYGRENIIRPVGPFGGPVPILPEFASEEKELLEWIWEQYGNLKGTELSDLTHAYGTPWRNIAERYNFIVPPSLEIPDDEDREYFSRLSAERGADANSEPQLPLA